SQLEGAALATAADEVCLATFGSDNVTAAQLSDNPRAAQDAFGRAVDRRQPTPVLRLRLCLRFFDHFLEVRLVDLHRRHPFISSTDRQNVLYPYTEFQDNSAYPYKEFSCGNGRGGVRIRCLILNRRINLMEWRKRSRVC